MHFPAKQPCTNDTVCNAAKQHCTQYHLYTGHVGHVCPAGHERVNILLFILLRN